MNESRFSYPVQFAILIGLMGLCIVIGGAVMSLIGMQVLNLPLMEVPAALNKPENAALSRFLNVFSSIIAFFFPALILAVLKGKRPLQQLGFNNTLNWKQASLVVLITFASMILSGALGELNERIPLPAKWLADARKLEETYKAAMLGMASMRNFGEYMLALVVLAAAPATVEEILFRGGFQQVLVAWTQNKWIGIIITSILFSAIHISYFGFLPRAMLGIVLGLVFYYSKNIWLNIFLHFLNNAIVVTQIYIVTLQGKSIAKTMDESVPLWWGAIAIVLLIIFFRPFRQESEKLLARTNKQIDSSPENILS